MKIGSNENVKNMVSGKLHVPDREKGLRYGYVCGDCILRTKVIEMQVVGAGAELWGGM